MPPTLFSFADLVARVAPGFGGERKWKLVRHMDGRLPDPVTLFHLDREALEFYQGEQGKDIFGNCEGIFSFLGLPNDRALFFGAYFVRDAREGILPPPELRPSVLREFYAGLEAKGAGPHRFLYTLERDARFAPLEMSVVIEWGPAGRSWHQWGMEKAVVELRDPNSLDACPDYVDLDVPLGKLAFLMQHEEANPSWRERLAAVGGIYLLTDHANHKLYVGQAGGNGGFWARWRAYADGRSGNVAIDPAFASGALRPESTSLSILQVVALGDASKDVLDRLETRWKRRLCSREAGYNRN